MVAVASGCDGYTPWTAFIVSSIAGPVYLFVSHCMVNFKVDDPVDAVAIHFSSGRV
jgi:ammonium transporter, Amt family